MAQQPPESSDQDTEAASRDTGLACALFGIDAAALAADRALLGQLLEAFVFQEPSRQAIGQQQPLSFFHFRDKDEFEVDVVIERGARQIAGIEIKAAATVTGSDFHGLRKPKDAAGAHYAGGVVLHDGEVEASFGDGLHAVPLRHLWEEWRCRHPIPSAMTARRTFRCVRVSR